MENKTKKRLGWHDPAKVKIMHVMADGSVRESLEGYIFTQDSPAVKEFIRLARLIAFGSPNTTKD